MLLNQPGGCELPEVAQDVKDRETFARIRIVLVCNSQPRCRLEITDGTQESL